MDPAKQREIASKGGRAAHEKGTAHEFNSDEAREAGRKGGEAVSRNREHMSAIGRKGGEARGANSAGRSNASGDGARELAGRASGTMGDTVSRGDGRASAGAGTPRAGGNVPADRADRVANAGSEELGAGRTGGGRLSGLGDTAPGGFGGDANPSR
jgi:general stress protein YciG